MRSSGAPRWTQLDLEELRRFSDLFGADVHAGADASRPRCGARSVIGGTAPEAVRQALAQARALVEG